MYILPLLAVLLICLAIFISPILAAIIFALFLIGLGVYKFLGRGTEPEHSPAPDDAATPAPGAEQRGSEEEDTGAWGETWPERSR